MEQVNFKIKRLEKFSNLILFINARFKYINLKYEKVMYTNASQKDVYNWCEQRFSMVLLYRGRLSKPITDSS